MSNDIMSWLNADDGDLDGQIDGFDTDGDGVIDTQATLVDLNGDGVGDAYYAVKGMDTNGDGTADYFVEFIDSNLDGVIDIQNAFSDINGDGVADMSSQIMDTDFDGVFDVQHTVGDINGDGIVEDMQMQYVDSNHDGIIDSVYQSLDTNFDGVPDVVQVMNDTNGDGVPDMVSQTQYIDSDGDGIIDTISFVQDQNGDGQFDVSYIAQDTNMDGLFDIISNSQNGLTPDHTTPVYDPGTGTASVNFDPNHGDDSHVIGEPSDDMTYWHLQETNSSCAVASQEFVLEDLLHRDFTEAELRDFAQEHGWYSENGTPMEDVGNILEAYGLNVDRHQGGTIHDIEQCLQNGGDVIVGVDADEIWYHHDNDTFGPGDDANHALEVIGVDYSDPNHPMVILNDSGTPDGCGSMVPLDLFLDAWEDSGFYMVEAYK